MLYFVLAILATLILFIVSMCLLLFIFIGKKPVTHSKQLIVLGSGGHTSEMMHMLSIIQPSNPVFVLSDTDKMSVHLLSKTYPDAEYLRIPRAREVKQSYFTAVFSTFKAQLFCLKLLQKIRPHLVLANGPGTALPVVIAAAVLRFLNFFSCKIVFVESYCRIERLSMTGKLATLFVDRFVVNWKDAAKSAQKYGGWEPGKKAVGKKRHTVWIPIYPY